MSAEFDTVRVLALFVVGYAAVNLLHEPTHYAAARLLGCPARMTLGREFSAEVVVPRKRSMWVDRIITLAPTLTGTTVALGYVTVMGLPPLTAETTLAAFLWAYYTLPSPADLNAAAWPDGDRPTWIADPSKRAASVWSGLALVAVLVVVAAPLTPSAYEKGLTLVAQAFVLGGSLILLTEARRASGAKGDADETVLSTNDASSSPVFDSGASASGLDGTVEPTPENTHDD